MGTPQACRWRSSRSAARQVEGRFATDARGGGQAGQDRAACFAHIPGFARTRARQPSAYPPPPAPGKS